jgi:uncharacterized protein
VPSAAVIDTQQKVYDNAGLFSEDEANSLKQLAQELVKKCSFDVLILTINDAEGKDSRSYADDFYDDNGFGLGDDKSGLVLLIDMDNREAYISTSGIAIRIFTDARLDSIIDAITGHLSNGEYAKASSIFLDNVDYYFGKGIPSDQYNMDTETKERDYYSNQEEAPKGVAKSLKNLTLFILIAIGSSLVIVGLMALNNRGKKTTNAGTYLEPGSFVLNDKRDIYVRTTLTQHQINTNSGSGGSSTHTSRSGSTHGGRGGKF